MTNQGMSDPPHCDVVPKGSVADMDLTKEFNRYRLVARELWNSGFWLGRESTGWDDRERFDELKQSLFRAMIESRFGQGAYFVRPAFPWGVPVHIENPRRGDSNRYWDHPRATICPSEAELKFIDYFDWQPLGVLDFQFVLVQIIDFPSCVELVGRQALLEAGGIEVSNDRSGGG